MIEQAGADLSVSMKERFGALVTEETQELVAAFDAMSNIEASFKRMLEMSKFMLEKNRDLSQQT
jgi:hypothetical protein